MGEKKEKAAATQTCTETIFLQFNGKEAYVDRIRESIRKDYDSVKKGSDPAKTLKIYLKPGSNEKVSSSYSLQNGLCDDFGG